MGPPQYFLSRVHNRHIESICFSIIRFRIFGWYNEDPGCLTSRSKGKNRFLRFSHIIRPVQNYIQKITVHHKKKEPNVL